jgi:hypothetical protein
MRGPELAGLLAAVAVEIGGRSLDQGHAFAKNRLELIGTREFRAK